MILSAEDYAELTRLSSPPSGTELTHLLEDAEEDVHTMTFNRIPARGFDALTTFQQEKVKRAIALQADFRYQYTDLLTSPLSSYSVNGVSMSWDRSVVREYAGAKTCGEVMSCLAQTGLMYRGVMA